MTGRAALEAVERDKPDLIVLDLGLPDIDGVDVCVRGAAVVERADPGAVRARRRRRQGARAGCGRRRLRHEAVRRRGAAGAHPRRAAAGRESVAGERADRARRPGDRSRALSRAAGRRRGAADAEGIRAADVSGAASRPRADAPHDPEGDLGTARGRSARAPARAGRIAAQEDRAEPRVAADTSSPNRGSATASPISDARLTPDPPRRARRRSP